MTQEISLDLASGARLMLLYFSEHELRWIFTYRYIGLKAPGADPDVVNDVKLTANFIDGLIAPQIVLSMHVIIPSRLGQQFLAGMDISPGAKTYLEFTYARTPGEEYTLVEICRGAAQRVRLDDDQGLALVRPIAFPFPILNSLPVKFGRITVPFLLNNGDTAHFELPTRTLR